jgi:uncharacterized protein (UPF0218 family)
MQSRSGSNYLVDSRTRDLITGFKHRICTIDEIRKYSSGRKVIAVGDVTSANLRKAGIHVSMEVVDLKTRRGETGMFPHQPGSIRVHNPAGTLTGELFDAISKYVNEPGFKRIEILGEEDLSVIPIIIYTELNTLILYGIPDVGMACLDVTTELRKHVNELIEGMEKT